MSSIFLRFAARHNLSVFPAIFGSNIDFEILKDWIRRPKPSEMHTYNMVFLHTHNLIGPVPAATFKFYSSIIRDAAVVTIVREPFAHALSWLAYFKAPRSNAELFQMIHSEVLPNNVGSLDFGIDNEEQALHFLQDFWHKFDLVCLLEDIDRCLVLLRRRMNWDPLDITYLHLQDLSKDPVRFDGQKVFKAPKFESLPARTQRTLRKKTLLDRLIYQAATKLWNALLDEQDESFAREVAAFRDIQGRLSEVCTLHSRHPACRWYSVSGSNYHTLVVDKHAAVVDFLE
eukprot:m.104493 g.104493  ORF g.104493 m.104493 type:complete len:287 (-) comp51597_c0_seq1:232-1092(-)